MNESLPDEKGLHAAKILILDDEEIGVRCLEWALRKADFPNFRSLTNFAQARQAFVEFQPDVVLLDLNMPKLEGFGVLEQICKEHAAWDFVPVLVITGENAADARNRAMAVGAHDFIDKPVDYSVLILRIKNVLRTRFLCRQNQELRARIEAAAGGQSKAEKGQP
jgi:putative two-component system response regulator